MHWFVESVVAKDSRKIPNTTCWHITLRSVERAHTMQTWVESRFQNFANWREIIELYPLGMIISEVELLDTKRADADSQPQIIFHMDRMTMVDQLEEKWQKKG